MLDVYLEKFRWLIGGGLILLILLGLSLLTWQKFSSEKKTNENGEIVQLKEENNQLRAQLSQNAQQVAGVATSQDQSGKININTADLNQLDKLPGIGPVRAQDIINYRNAHQGFRSIEELKNVKGIGEVTFEKLKNEVTVGN